MSLTETALDRYWMSLSPTTRSLLPLAAGGGLGYLTTRDWKGAAVGAVGLWALGAIMGKVPIPVGYVK